jgi:trehalose 6-phosphate phosphatase
MDADALVAAARDRLPGLLVATDFDGTLAPIVDDPERSQPVEGTGDVLRALVDHGARILIVTGRDAATAVRLSGLADLPGLVVEGLYGMQHWEAGELTTPDEPPSLAALRERIPAWRAEHHVADAVWVEDKGLSLVVQTRQAPDPAGEQRRLHGPAEALAAQLGLEVHEGRFVLEFRVPGHDKGEVLRRLAAGASGVLYAGDDVGDGPAFTAARELGGWTVFAASAERPGLEGVPVDVTVDGPHGVLDLLRRIAR